MSLKITSRHMDGVTILDLRGRSTIEGESERLGKRLKELVAAGERKILLNMAEVTQIDSSGVSVIVEACILLRRRGGDLRLVRPAGRVLEILTVLRLIKIIPHFQSEADAIASFKPKGIAAKS